VFLTNFQEACSVSHVELHLDFIVNGESIYIRYTSYCISYIIYIYIYNIIECHTKEVLEWFGDFKIGGKIIHTGKYADDFVLLAKEDAMEWKRK
jgi:hypothetical protein